MRYVLAGGDMVVVVSDERHAVLQRDGMVAANLDVDVHRMSAATWERVREQLVAANPDLHIVDLTHQ